MQPRLPGRLPNVPVDRVGPLRLGLRLRIEEPHVQSRPPGQHRRPALPGADGAICPVQLPVREFPLADLGLV